jgi:chemotaxis protein MotB
VKTVKYFVILIISVSLYGCCSIGKKKTVESLSEQLRATGELLTGVTHKFDLARAENLNLKKEIALFRKNQDIDSKSFIKASEVFQNELKSDGAQDDMVGMQITERGLVLSILAEKIFVTGTDDLSDAGKGFLDKIVALVEKRFSSNYIFIEGHTDSQSLAVFEWKSDWDFSFARALSVLKYFTENKRLDPWRLSASGFGQYRPCATNETKEGRRLNRRIEVVISPQKSRHTEMQIRQEEAYGVR